MRRPFLIKLFVPSGDPTGVLIASRDDWSGRAVVFPRDLFGEVKGRREFNQPGVYVLTGPGKVYIGEGDPVGPRIESHIKNKDFWDRGVFFTADNGRLNKAHIQLLESQLLKIAQDVGRTALENRKQESEPSLSEEDFAFASNFLNDIRQMLPILGFLQLSPDESSLQVDGGSSAPPPSESTAEGDADLDEPVSVSKRARIYNAIPKGLQFNLQSKGANSNLEVVDGGVLVKSGSIVASEESNLFEVSAPAYCALRRQLIESGVIQATESGLYFTQDQFFSSGSAAAAVVRGSVSNSEWWKSQDGKTLGEYIRKSKDGKGS